MSNPKRKILAKTESVCPECLELVEAKVVEIDETVFLEKACDSHGSWKVPLWRGAPDYKGWQRPKRSSRPAVCYTAVQDGCPFDCGLCADHRQNPCSVLLEVTQRCSLGCPVCFADVGSAGISDPDPGIDTISDWYDKVITAAGHCNIQLSGGEPTQRDDLPEIIALGRRKGFTFIQINSNGLRLAEEPDYATTLAEAGLSTVFLQFDGTNDNIYSTLRGRPLFSEKVTAIERCAAAGLGVVLVPTLVPGVNTGDLGEIIRFALTRLPAVRGVHFQPVSYFGRYTLGKPGFERFTLPEVMRAIETQSNGLINAEDFIPPGTENARCSFHGSFLVLPDGRLRRIGSAASSCCGTQDGREGLVRTISSVARQWAAPSSGSATTEPACCDDDVLDLDFFLERATNHSLSISCMAFQDAWNLDLDRLRECCISVMSPEGKLIPFCAYNLTGATGKTLYRHKKELPI